ncbi:hypothetical protein [Kribbella swartbergensis]
MRARASWWRIAGDLGLGHTGEVGDAGVHPERELAVERGAGEDRVARPQGWSSYAALFLPM